MTPRLMIAAALAALGLLPTTVSAATIGGTYYAVQYDFSEFFAATDGKPFRVILAGNPFPDADGAMVARDLLPIMQAAKPRPALTFTYDAPVERPRPDYRLVLVSNAANDLGGESVCRGEMRFKPGARHAQSFRRVLPQRPVHVVDDGLDARDISGGSAGGRSLPGVVPGRVQRCAGPEALSGRRLPPLGRLDQAVAADASACAEALEGAVHMRYLLARKTRRDGA